MRISPRAIDTWGVSGSLSKAKASDFFQNSEIVAELTQRIAMFFKHVEWDVPHWKFHCRVTECGAAHLGYHFS